MIDVDRIRCRRGEFVTVERDVGPCNNRPRARMAGRFTGDVPSVEFLESRADFVEVVRLRAVIRPSESISTTLRNSIWNAPGCGLARDTGPAEEKAFASSRDGRRRTPRGPNVGEGPHVRDFDVATASDLGVHDPSVVVDSCIDGQ